MRVKELIEMLENNADPCSKVFMRVGESVKEVELGAFSEEETHLLEQPVIIKPTKGERKLLSSDSKYKMTKCSHVFSQDSVHFRSFLLRDCPFCKGKQKYMDKERQEITGMVVSRKIFPAPKFSPLQEVWASGTKIRITEMVLHEDGWWYGAEGRDCIPESALKSSRFSVGDTVRYSFSSSITCDKCGAFKSLTVSQEGEIVEVCDTPPGTYVMKFSVNTVSYATKLVHESSLTLIKAVK